MARTFVRGSETSEQAADAMLEEVALSIREKVFRFIDQAGREGVTDHIVVDAAILAGEQDL